MSMRRNVVKSLRVLGAVIAILTVSQAMADDDFSSYVDQKGNISFPEGFRTSMVHLGSWFVPEGDASGFHDVYTELESVITYRMTGKFLDGATLVKELQASAAGTYATGLGVRHAKTEGLKQWFVMIKDAKGRFGDDPRWGDGWGWALFKPNAKGKNAATNYQVDCLGCHVPAREKDWVYTEAYPTLNAE